MAAAVMWEGAGGGKQGPVAVTPPANSAVIAVHSLAHTHPAGDPVARGLMCCLQFGRAVFFALTGFVLVHPARRRPMDALRFWRRRFPLVLAPYAAWTAIYEAVSHGGAGGVTGYLWDLVSGPCW